MYILRWPEPRNGSTWFNSLGLEKEGFQDTCFSQLRWVILRHNFESCCQLMIYTWIPYNIAVSWWRRKISKNTNIICLAMFCCIAHDNDDSLVRAVFLCLFVKLRTYYFRGRRAELFPRYLHQLSLKVQPSHLFSLDRVLREFSFGEKSEDTGKVICVHR